MKCVVITALSFLPSCYRPPCKERNRRCETGFYFSEEVCRCIPTYWRRVD